MRQEFPGVSHYRDRHGKLRWRYRKDGVTYNLGTEYGSPEFLRRHAAAMKGERLLHEGEAAATVSQAPSGSLARVINSWFTSPEFVKLGASTQTNYRGIGNRIINLETGRKPGETFGQGPVASFDETVVKKIMGKKADTPESANGMLRVLRLALDHAKNDLKLIKVNPAREVKKYRTDTEGFHTWTEDEIDRYSKRHPEGTLADLVFALALYTGASRADLVQLGPHNLSNGRLKYSRQKMRGRKGVVIDIPLHPELKRRLDALPDDRATFLQTVNGTQRSAAGLGNLMQLWRDEAKTPDCTLHGLRKAIARRLAEAGATPHEIMSVTGHKTLAEVERYTSAASRAGMADRAMSRMEDDMK